MEYNTLANSESITKAMETLAARGVTPIHVASRVEALQKIQEMIPQGSSVMNGSSRTLEEVGFIDYLKSDQHGWKNLHAEILAEQDKAKQAVMRKQAVLSDYYLGSVHAIAETGEMVIASNSGSQLPHIVYTSPHIIFVAGIQKIMPDITAALARVREYVLPLEDQRMKDAGMGGSAISKLLIFEREPAYLGRSVSIILIDEKLGF